MFDSQLLQQLIFFNNFPLILSQSMLTFSPIYGQVICSMILTLIPCEKKIVGYKNTSLSIL